jgi:hypothetical protein
MLKHCLGNNYKDVNTLGEVSGPLSGAFEAASKLL